jgi:hypothetical protein
MDADTKIYPGTKANDRGKPFVWNGRPGIESGQPRVEAQPNNERRAVSPEELSLINDLGSAGIPTDGASKLAVIILGMQEQIKTQGEQITFMQGLLRDALTPTA